MIAPRVAALTAPVIVDCNPRKIGSVAHFVTVTTYLIARTTANRHLHDHRGPKHPLGKGSNLRWMTGVPGGADVVYCARSRRAGGPGAGGKVAGQGIVRQFWSS